MSNDQTQKDSLDEPVPSVWPGAFKLYAASKAAIMYNLGSVLGIIGLTLAVSFTSSMTNPNQFYVSGTTPAATPSGTGSIIYFLSQLVSVLLSAALVYVVIAGVKRQKISVSESLQAGWSKYLVFLGQSLLLGLIAIGSILLFIIPAFFIMPRLVLAQYYLLEGNMGVTDAIRASWQATKGHVGKVWGIFGVTILIVLLCITIVGIPFAIYLGLMYQAAIPVLYMYLKTRQSPAVPEPSTASSDSTSPQS